MLPNSMDLMLGLTSLQAVRDHGTVTEAAAVLNRSPSAVSAQIKRLGALADRPLTTPTGRRVTLTPYAHRLIDEGMPLALELTELLTTRDRDPARRLTGQVRVAAFATALRGGVLDAVGALRRDEPDLSVTLTEADPAEAVELLHRGRVDLAVIHHWESQPLPLPNGTSNLPLGVDPADVVAPARIADERRAWEPPHLAGYDWISTSPGTLCATWLRTMFARHGLNPTIACHAPGFALHLDFVAAGLGLALVPRLGRGTLESQVRTLRLDESTPRRHVSLILRTAQRSDPAIDRVGRALAAHLTPSLDPPAR
ncbi:MAG: LysR family transcriptional regulator [Actinomycetia bacterium]|nr:LysR family transcriptional regulator [Actinomycetes bacterium]